MLSVNRKLLLKSLLGYIPTILAGIVGASLFGIVIGLCFGIPVTDSGWVFRLTPFVMVGVMLTIATALPVVTVGSPLPQLGDLITL
ncbi:2-hydroxycarboxylate transporter family protein, partial [Salmonella enterica subsp. enterica serovar Anatum]|nr:2-hydroxycarboxylate transporter family protein [Salmonella enterica subsp. enterica serovar Anatum]